MFILPFWHFLMCPDKTFEEAKVHFESTGLTYLKKYRLQEIKQLQKDKDTIRRPYVEGLFRSRSNQNQKTDPDSIWEEVKQLKEMFRTKKEFDKFYKDVFLEERQLFACEACGGSNSLGITCQLNKCDWVKCLNCDNFTCCGTRIDGICRQCYSKTSGGALKIIGDYRKIGLAPTPTNMAGHFYLIEIHGNHYVKAFPPIAMVLEIDGITGIVWLQQFIPNDADKKKMIKDVFENPDNYMVHEGEQVDGESFRKTYIRKKESRTQSQLTFIVNDKWNGIKLGHVTTKHLDLVLNLLQKAYERSDTDAVRNEFLRILTGNLSIEKSTFQCDTNLVLPSQEQNGAASTNATSYGHREDTEDRDFPVLKLPDVSESKTSMDLFEFKYKDVKISLEDIHQTLETDFVKFVDLRREYQNRVKEIHQCWDLLYSTLETSIEIPVGTSQQPAEGLIEVTDIEFRQSSEMTALNTTEMTMDIVEEEEEEETYSFEGVSFKDGGICSICLDNNATLSFPCGKKHSSGMCEFCLPMVLKSNGDGKCPFCRGLALCMTCLEQGRTKCEHRQVPYRYYYDPDSESESESDDEGSFWL